jgi:hypothetical protein
MSPALGGVVENGQKNKSPLISTKFGDIVWFVFILIFWRKFSTGKVLFGGFCGIIGSACNLHAIRTENETLLVVDPVPPKARTLEVWVWVMSKKLW